MPAFKDLTGERFGRWEVLRRAPNVGDKVMWDCRCGCGCVVAVQGNSLRSGTSKQCLTCYHSSRY